MSETDIRSLFIDPALKKSGWIFGTKIVQKYTLTAGQVVLKRNSQFRIEGRRADYVLIYKPNIVLAVVEAKDNKHLLRSGTQQALDYAEALDAPFAFTSNGDPVLTSGNCSAVRFVICVGLWVAGRLVVARQQAGALRQAMLREAFEQKEMAMLVG